MLLALGITAVSIGSLLMVTSTQPWPSRIIISGFRSQESELLALLSLLLLSPENGVLFDNITLKAIEGWNGLEHLSNDYTVVLRAFSATHEYLRKLHDLSRFGMGSQDGRQILGIKSIYGSGRVKKAYDLLFQPTSCLLYNETECQIYPNRLPTTGFIQNGTVSGVEELLQRFFRHL